MSSTVDGEREDIADMADEHAVDDALPHDPVPAAKQPAPDDVVSDTPTPPAPGSVPASTTVDEDEREAAALHEPFDVPSADDVVKDELVAAAPIAGEETKTEERAMPDGLDPSHDHGPDSVLAPTRDDEDTAPLREIGVDTPPPDDRQCRICLGGPDEEAEYGRLISPCLCAGSIRYVHMQCINQWRERGTNAKGFLECPQCGYAYHIRRTLVYGLARSRLAIVALTTFLFMTMTLVAGHFLLKYLVAAAIEADDAARAAEAAAKAAGLSAADLQTDTTGGHFDGDFWESEDGHMVMYVGGATLVYDVVIESIETFLIFASDAYDYLRHDAGWVSVLALTLVIRFILGLALLGSISFLTLLGSLSLFAPLQLIHTLRGTGLFDGIRRRMSGRNGTILVVTFVLIGIFNSIVQVYDIVQSLTLKMLRYVETQIVEVNSPEGLRARQEQHVPGWWGRWWAERRWRTMRGWYEVWLRGWVNVKERVRQWRAGPALA